MEKKVAFIFPGQGSQRPIGKEFSLIAEIRLIFEAANDILGYAITDIPEDELRKTIYTQPSVFIMSYACLIAGLLEGSIREEDLANVAGHSLGEYTAAVASKSITFEKCLPLVRDRGCGMDLASDPKKGGVEGGMASVWLKTENDKLELQNICDQAGKVRIPNINTSEQVVISGSKVDLARAISLIDAYGLRWKMLPVGGAFHTDLMLPAKEIMVVALEKIEFSNPNVPIIANTTAKPLYTKEQVKQELLDQICGNVLFKESVEFMIRNGVTEFVEIGPGGVLTGIIKKIDSNVKVRNISPENFIDV